MRSHVNNEEDMIEEFGRMQEQVILGVVCPICKEYLGGNSACSYCLKHNAIPMKRQGWICPSCQRVLNPEEKFCNCRQQLRYGA